MAKTVPVKTLKKMLKKAGLKTTGRKAALTRRAKKAKLMKGGRLAKAACAAPDGSTRCGKDCTTSEQLVEDASCPEVELEKKGWFSG
jgi:hypothetical protein